MHVDGNDLLYITDIADCAADIGEITGGIAFGEFERDRARKLAVERQLSMIGQAACKINRMTRARLAGIPWAALMGLKGKLAHGHGEVLPERVWAAAGNPLRKMLKDLEEIDEVREYLTEKKLGAR